MIGAAPIALTLVRSLGRHGIPVCVLRDGDHRVATTSRFASFSLPWSIADEREQVDYLERLATEHRLAGWTLYPTDDNAAALLGRHHAALTEHFVVASPPWPVLRWAYDKRLTYRLAAERGVPFPRTHYPKGPADVAELDCTFPVILKPAVKLSENVFTHAKAWRAADAATLLDRYEQAIKFVPPETVMVQELIPGGGEGQLSYAALCDRGRPKAVLVARRMRQYPPDFGRASSFVETIDSTALDESSRRLLKALGLTGIVEIEFKWDPRDGEHKLLDINARPWAWLALGARAGVDFPYLFWCVLHGRHIPTVRASSGFRWMRPATDVRAAIDEIRARRLTFLSYARSLRGPIVFAIFAPDDPLPAVLELAFSTAVLYKRSRRLRSDARSRSRR